MLCAQELVHITGGPVVEFVGADSAIVAWSTDGQSTSVLHYGTQRDYLTDQTQGLESAGTHRVTLQNLQPGTTYFVQAESSGAKSPVATFTTKGEPQQQKSSASLLVGPVVQDVTDNSGRIWWYPELRGTAQMRFGTNRLQLDRYAAVKSTAAEFKKLQPETTYFYSLSAAGGEVARGHFTTEPKGYKKGGFITNGPVIEFLDYNAVVIAWSTNVNASSLVRYSQDPNNLNKNAAAPWGQETHRLTIKDLKPDADYYFLVESAQAAGSGTMAKSNIGRFHTLREGETPLRNIAAPGK